MQPVEGYEIELRGESTTTNLWGNWLLPIYKSAIPGSMRIQIYAQGRNYIDKYHFTGPWPMWNALFPMEYDLEIDPSEPQGKRIKVVHHSQGNGPLSVLVRWMEGFSIVFADTESKSPVFASSIDKENQRDGGNQTEGVWISKDRIPLCLIEIENISIEEFPGFFRSQGKAYFTLTIDGKPTEETTLLYPDFMNSQTFKGENLWFPAVSYEKPDTVYFGRFPVKSLKASWLPVSSKESINFRGVTGNLTKFVSCVIEENLKEIDFKIQPNGHIELHMWADNSSLLGSFDIVKALETPNRSYTLKSDKKGQDASVVIKVIPGWLATEAQFVEVPSVKEPVYIPPQLPTSKRDTARGRVGGGTR